MKLEILNKNKEANVKIYAVLVLIIVVLVAVGIYMYISDTEDDKTWPDPIDDDEPELGDFGQEIILKYSDGTLQSVKPIVDGSILAVWHENKEVAGVQYRLKAKASGSGQSTVKIDPTGYMTKCYTFVLPSNIRNTYTLGTGSSTYDLNVDDAWHTIIVWDAEIVKLVPNTLSDGTWVVDFTPEGTLKYKVGSDEWKIADNPANIQLIFVKSGNIGGQIVVTFTGETQIGYK